MQNNLPPNWSWVKLGDVIGTNGIFVDGDWVESKDQDPDGEVRLIQLADIGEIRFRNKSNRFLTRTKAVELKCTFLKKDDLLIARMPDPLGRACLFPFDAKDKFVTVVDVAVVRVDQKNTNPKYLCYIVNAPQSRYNISALQSGSTRKRISRKNLATINFPLPPLPEQRRIVEKIEELFSELDNGIENLKKAKAQIKTYRQAVLKFAFEGKLVQGQRTKDKGKSEGGELPEGLPAEVSTKAGWKWVKLGTLINFIGSGATPRGGRSVYQKNGIMFIRSQNVYPNKLRLDDVAYISEKINNNLKRSVVKPKDVLLNITGASIGRATFIPENFQRANVNQHVCIIRTSHEKVTSKYLSSFLNSPFAQDYITRIQIGATRQALNYSQIKNFPFPLAPIEEQIQITSEIEKRFSVVDKMEAAIDESLKKAEALRQSILKKAFEGKLV
ncbi:MAG TPA: restriction endonuclease subunit S [Ignavibacteria bacterium]|nr:restriction endonuclease subunit S [Ignavibacteria bacterium]